MRVRKDFKRTEGEKSSRLVVIASEGRETENLYFEALKEEHKSPNVHVEILRRENDDSSPEHVLEQIRKFMEEYKIEQDDQLWVVVDKDRWSAKMLSSVARYCFQNKNLRFCVSNPCFELWLLLHLDDVNSYSENEKLALAANRKNSRHGKTWLKHKLADLLTVYDESNYDAASFMPLVEDAVSRAITLDVEPSDRWPQTTGTRVYLLVRSINGKMEV